MQAVLAGRQPNLFFKDPTKIIIIVKVTFYHDVAMTAQEAMEADVAKAMNVFYGKE